MLPATSRFPGIANRILAVAATSGLVMFAVMGIGSSTALAAETSCTPSNIMVYSSRIHIKCDESVGGIQYFAAPVTDAAYVSRVLSIISTATVAGRTVIVLYDPSDTSGSSVGCQANDCRLIQAVGFWR